MSVDRVFAQLNNIEKDWEKKENSVDKWKRGPSNSVNFIKSSTLKLLISALLVSWMWNTQNKNKSSLSSSDFQNKNTETVYNDDIMWMDVEATRLNIIDFADIESFKTLYRPSFIKNELYSSSPIFKYEEYDKDHISGISIDEELGLAPWTHTPQTIREFLYLSMFQKLSYKDYQNMFKWFKDLEQWRSLSNCWVIAAIKNIARSKYFDVLMMTSIEKNGDDSFNLYMPLWEPRWIKVIITNKDLETDGSSWPIWYRILEIWFAKYLLFQKRIIPNTSVTMTNELMKKIEWWIAWDAMSTFLWPKSFSYTRLEDDIKDKVAILNCLYSFDPKNLSPIFVTPINKDWKSDKHFFELWWETIYHGHAYSICDIEKKWDIIKYVVLDNTWNTDRVKWWKTVKLKLSDFLNCFSFLYPGKITDNFLNFSTSSDEVKAVDSYYR